MNAVVEPSASGALQDVTRNAINFSAASLVHELAQQGGLQQSPGAHIMQLALQTMLTITMSLVLRLHPLLPPSSALHPSSVTRDSQFLSYPECPRQGSLLGFSSLRFLKRPVFGRAVSGRFALRSTSCWCVGTAVAISCRLFWATSRGRCSPGGIVSAF